MGKASMNLQIAPLKTTEPFVKDHFVETRYADDDNDDDGLSDENFPV